MPPFAAIATLARRFSSAGGKRIPISDDDFQFLSIEAWGALENHSELLAKCCNSSIALAAFKSAKSERPKNILTLRKGAHLMQRHRPEEKGTDG